VLVGPYTGALCIGVVLLVQALLMADGGITALGTNITLMALVGAGVGWLVFAGARRVLPKRIAMVAPAAGVAALVSVPAAALAFTVLFTIGGTAPIETDKVLTAMLGWHTVIGIGEAVITMLVVGTVTATRPDLVYGAKPLLDAREQQIRGDVEASR
jgi:cobalt/nickel transport system permease protein